MQRSANLFGICAWIITLALYVPIYEVQGYNITIGAIFCVPYIIICSSSIKRINISIYYCISLLLYPIIVMNYNSIFPKGMTPESLEFIKSYALWSVSIIIIFVAYSSDRPIFPSGLYFLISTLIVIMLIQVIGSIFLNNNLGFRVVSEFLNIKLTQEYSDGGYATFNRAIGLYYEPSMCGRIVTTLCFMDLALSRKVVRNLIAWGACVLLTQSFGAIVLGVILSLILLTQSSRQTTILILFASALAVCTFPFVVDRVNNEGTSETSSTYIRTQAPLRVISYIFFEHPAGVPIGSAELLAIKTGFYDDTGETKITNGVYEIVTYFGISSIIGILLLLVYSVSEFAKGRRERSAAMIYIAIATAVSGSYLSIESTLIIAFFVSCMRYSERYWKE